MKNPLLLTLDMGTSSVRAMLFDARGRALPGAEAQMGYAQRMTADGGVETDAETLLERTTTCVRRLLAQTDSATLARLAGVGVSCFWHSLVGVDGSGQAATPVYSWADTRAKFQAETLRGAWDDMAYHARTGCVLHPSFWPAKLCWLRETQPEIFGRVSKWMGFGEYLFLRLFGTSPCSFSMASGTGLFDPNTKNWDAESLEKLPIDARQLNVLCDRNDAQSGLVEEWARDFGPLAGLPWFPAVGDGACSNIGGGGTKPTRIVINVGTSGAMRVTVEADKLVIPDGLFAYRMDGKRFLVGGAFANGGNVYSWAHDALQLPAPTVFLRRLATMPPDGHGLTVLPFWAGERSPGWHLDARAVVVGMNLHTTPLDILRASLEAVAYRFAAVHDLLNAQFPDATDILASGNGIAHNPAWAQIFADVFGTPVTLSKTAEASSRGAALLTADSLHLPPDLDDAPVTRARTFTPDAKRHAVYQTARARHEELYAQMLDGKSQ